MNVLAYRLTHPLSFTYPWSVCPHCKTHITWYDNIPVLSWLILRGTCRTCSQPISVLYPFIELLTPLIMLALMHTTPSTYWPSYFLFFSALIVTIRTDLETLLISRFASLFLVPVGLLLSALGWLPITPVQSVTGALFGYGILYGTARLFYLLTKKQGIGEGDFELLACIGSFTGLFGCWMSLLIGSLLGSVLSVGYLVITQRPANIKIPFGPFLSAGAIIFVLFKVQIMRLLLF